MLNKRHFLIADDVDEAKIARMKGELERPGNVVHVARSIHDALAFINMPGVEIDGAAIDFDFLGEGTGDEIIAPLRQKFRNAPIALVTARDGRAYEEASRHARGAGADATFTSTERFEGSLGAQLAA
jgi:ActR/RegA family two-component response regulator